MPSTVLLVEDEASIGALVQTYLRRDGYGVVWVRSGEAALAELPRHAVSLVVLDIGLPDMDGLEVCRRIGGAVPVIMLTARDGEADRVAGLELGADDYIAKPFSPRELVARVKAVLRRSDRHRDDVLSAGRLTVSRAAREARLDGTELDLTAREFDLLAFLLEHAGTVVSRDLLLECVWGFVAPGETRTVDTHMAQLRKKLAAPGLIQTVRGAGYKLVP